MGKEDAGDSNDGQRRELEVGTSRALTNPIGKDFPPLSEMVSRSLANIEASNKLSTLHRVGEHELHDPDYRLVCAWAEETGWSNEEVLKVLLRRKTKISEGRFVELVYSLSLRSIPQIEGLEVRILSLNRAFITDLDLIVAKWRGGRLGPVPLVFEKPTSTFKAQHSDGVAHNHQTA